MTKKELEKKINELEEEINELKHENRELQDEVEELEALTWELEKELDNPLLFDTENLSLTEAIKLQTVLENFNKFTEEEFLKIINKK